MGGEVWRLRYCPKGLWKNKKYGGGLFNPKSFSVYSVIFVPVSRTSQLHSLSSPKGSRKKNLSIWFFVYISRTILLSDRRIEVRVRGSVL